MKLLILSLFSLSAFGQVTISLQMPGETTVSVTLSAEAVSSTIAGIKAITTAPSGITLNGNLTSGTTTINVSNATGVLTGMGIMIDSEVSLITGVTSNALTVTRATIGTTAASHSTGAPVTFLRSGNGGELMANILMDTIRNFMTAAPGPIVIAANSAIATQQATITSTIAAGITDVP